MIVKFSLQESNYKKIYFSEDLKQFIWHKTNVAPCQQHLRGWKKEPQTPSAVLQTLDLPRENTLYLSLSQDGDLTQDT